jgi:hypothetical protein
LNVLAVALTAHNELHFLLVAKFGIHFPLFFFIHDWTLICVVHHFTLLFFLQCKQTRDRRQPPISSWLFLRIKLITGRNCQREVHEWAHTCMWVENIRSRIWNILLDSFTTWILLEVSITYPFIFASSIEWRCYNSFCIKI